jgi:tRNA-dihydrouridine synthase
MCVLLQGGGSGLLRRKKTLESVIRCMSSVINLPLTVKTRTGIYTDKNIAHILVPKLQEWGASLITVSFCKGCIQARGSLGSAFGESMYIFRSTLQ